MQYSSWSPLFYAANNDQLLMRYGASSSFGFNLASPADYLDADLLVSSPDEAAHYSKFDRFSPIGERSPSIGISLSPSDRDPFSRPSSELQGCFVPNSVNTSGISLSVNTPSPNTIVARSSSSLEEQSLGEEELQAAVVNVDDWATWREWDIKTAPSCPPLDQLFENKRKWRETFNRAVPPPMQRHCVFCRSMKKPPHEFLSHNVRDEKGNITCPVLGIYRCPNCGEKGHTIRYCLKPQTVTLPVRNNRNKPRTSSVNEPRYNGRKWYGGYGKSA